jgi:hypothetical protein
MAETPRTANTTKPCGLPRDIVHPYGECPVCDEQAATSPAPEGLTPEQVTALAREQDDMIREGSAELESLREQNASLTRDLARVRQERDNWEAAFEILAREERP